MNAQSEIDHLEKIINSEDPTPVRITPDGKVVPVQDTEYGWVVEHAESETSKPLYWRGDNHESRPEGDETPFDVWSYDHMQAVRFARKVDAERVKFLSEVRICEHGWG